MRTLLVCLFSLLIIGSDQPKKEKERGKLRGKVLLKLADDQKLPIVELLKYKIEKSKLAKACASNIKEDLGDTAIVEFEDESFWIKTLEIIDGSKKYEEHRVRWCYAGIVGVDEKVKFKSDVLKIEKNRFKPHVAVSRANKCFVIQNEDEVQYSIAFKCVKNKPFGREIPAKEQINLKKSGEMMEKEEIVEIGCNSHPWMKAYAVVTENVYNDVTDKMGIFTIDRIPVGKYKLLLWHERFPRDKQGSWAMKEFNIEIKKGENNITLELMLNELGFTEKK